MPDSLQERVVSLERMVSDLRSATDSIRAREALQTGNIPYRLARVTNDPVTGDNTFSIVFLDGTYSPNPGQQSAGFAQRQLSSKAVVYNLNGSVIDKDQEILVFPWNDRWWTWHGTGSSPPQTSSEVAVVEVFDSYGTPDLAPVNRLPEWVYSGRKINPALTQGEMDETDADDPWLSGEDIWLVDVSHGAITQTLQQNERYIGYKLGTMVIGQTSRPIYAIRHHQDESEIVEIYDGNYDDGSFVPSSSRIWGGRIIDPDTTTDQGWDGEDNYDPSSHVWIVDVNRTVKREELRNRERYLATRIGSLFDHNDDPRDVFAIKDDAQLQNAITGFSSRFNSQLRDLTFNENRLIRFQPADLKGVIKGVSWNQAGFYFTLEPGEYHCEFGAHGSSREQSVSTVDTVDINYSYVLLQSNADPVSTPNDWTSNSQSPCYFFAPPAGLFNSGHVTTLLSLTQTTSFRLVCGTGNSSVDFATMTNIYAAWWFLRKVNETV